MLEDSPDDYAVNLLHATILADSGKLDEAEAANYRLKEIGEASGDPSTAPRACLVPAAFAKEIRKDLKKAETLFEECLEKYPGNAFVTNEAMGFYDAIEKPERATELIREAAKQAPENLSLQASLASRLENTGDKAGAEQVLLAAVESFKSAGAWDLLANYYRRMGESQKALDALEKVIELSGEPTDSLRFVHADVLIDLDQLDRAEAVAKDTRGADLRHLDPRPDPARARRRQGRARILRAGHPQLAQQRRRALPGGRRRTPARGLRPRDLRAARGHAHRQRRHRRGARARAHPLSARRVAATRSRPRTRPCAGPGARPRTP